MYNELMSRYNAAKKRVSDKQLLIECAEYGSVLVMLVVFWVMVWICY